MNWVSFNKACQLTFCVGASFCVWLRHFTQNHTPTKMQLHLALVGTKMPRIHYVLLLVSIVVGTVSIVYSFEVLGRVKELGRTVVGDDVIVIAYVVCLLSLFTSLLGFWFSRLVGSNQKPRHPDIEL